MTALLSWLEGPPSRRGIRFARPDGWDWWSYDQLAGLVRRCAHAVVRAGVPAGGRVAIVEPTGPRFVGFLFGAMLAGATPTPVAPRPVFGDHRRYDSHLAAILDALRPHLIVREGHPDVPAASPAPPADRPPAELALIQFTSGTSGRVKGVRVPFPALEHNISAITAWLAMTPFDTTASWLPAHHDMGLVGCLLAPVVAGADLWLMSPATFVRDPVRYLRCFADRGARLSAMPAFGLEHIVRRVRSARLAGIDLAGWRALIVGAERVSPLTLDRFAALAQPHGFDPTALLPAYGLAEATLAVTGLPPHTGWTSTTHAGSSVVGCGHPLDGTTVDIVDESGLPLPDGVSGEIVVSGKSVAAGYLDHPTPMRPVHTGDAGFLAGGQLFVLGRFGDSMKIRGRTLFAEDVDASIIRAHPAAHGRLATVLGTVADHPHAVVALERPTSELIETARSVAALLTEGTAVDIIALPMGGIPRTTSGKPRRRVLWRHYLAGDLSPSRLPPAARLRRLPR